MIKYLKNKIDSMWFIKTLRTLVLIRILFEVILLAAFTVYVLTDKILLPYILYVDEVPVPNVIGEDISTAKILLDDSELKLDIQYLTSDKDDVMGNVIDAHPIEGKVVKIGTVIYLKVLGEQENYIVPKLISKSKNIGINILKSMGIKIDTIFYDYWNTICTDPNYINIDDSFDNIMDNCLRYKNNIIWNQSPKEGKKIFKNEGVTLYVSRGEFTPELYDVPRLIDLDLNEAINVINKTGLMLGDVKYINSNFEKNKVIDQSQLGKIRINHKINLTVQK